MAKRCSLAGWATPITRFEPVKAKVAGAASFPSMAQQVFDSLPIRFVDSEIGPVPKGWEVVEIGDVVTVKGGARPARRILTIGMAESIAG